MYKVALVYQLRNAELCRRGGELGYPEENGFNTINMSLIRLL